MFRERGIIVHEADVKSRTIIQDIGGSAAGSTAFTSGLRLVANKGAMSLSLMAVVMYIDEATQEALSLRMGHP
jgi:hypothetical protein